MFFIPFLLKLNFSLLKIIDKAVEGSCKFILFFHDEESYLLYLCYIFIIYINSTFLNYFKVETVMKKPKKAAFGECFFRIGDVCSLLPQETSVLVLTATATDEIIRDTTRGLGMKSNMYHISVSPDCPLHLS